MINGTGGGSSTQLSIDLFKIMAGTWMMLVSYKGMQQAITEKLLANGAVIRGGTPEQFAEYLRHVTEKWGKVIKAAGIKPQ